jgi:hypothetical protein
MLDAVIFSFNVVSRFQLSAFSCLPSNDLMLLINIIKGELYKNNLCLTLRSPKLKLFDFNVSIPLKKHHYEEEYNSSTNSLLGYAFVLM